MCLSFDRLDVEHFVGGAEAEGFIDRAGGVGTVQGDDAQAASMCFGEAEVDQSIGEAAPAVFRVDEDVEHVSAMFAVGIERVGRPVEDQEACRGDGPAVDFGDPACIFSFDDHAVYPWLKAAAHGVENGILGSAHGGEHGAAMGGDERGIGRGGWACFQHGEQYI